MNNVESIITTVITVIVFALGLSFGCAILKNVIDKMWEAIEKFFGETVTAFIAIFAFVALIIACIYGAVK